MPRAILAATTAMVVMVAFVLCAAFVVGPLFDDAIVRALIGGAMGALGYFASQWAARKVGGL